ncbi:MAG TPA: carbamoyl-phosphate synthase small subunit [Candidatus Omnitrophica bacterium]|nr:carbamoyl-phosphate synthase small subunit [Candidatus Omnitrophota bacterium]
MKKAILVLEDGFSLEGEGFGAQGEAFGEVVFNTSMSGYQEIITDPSYRGQIITMTYPLIGNYGINYEDVESKKLHLEGFVVKEISKIYSNYRAKTSLDEYLKKYNVVGVSGIDTRALTRHIRIEGAMRGVVSTDELDKKSLVEKIKASSGLEGRDLVKEVTCREAYDWAQPQAENKEARYKVVVLDCGVKFNILRSLVSLGAQVRVVPAKTGADEILNLKPDGVLLSNGPGDPAAVKYVIKTVADLLGKVPIFGICLGHQMLGLALAGKTYKLKFGHHGGNHPVMDLKTRKVEITSQNHGFNLDMDSFSNEDIEITHMNLYDNTVEGIRHKKISAFSVQYHPESSPGPHDAGYLFKKFVEMMRGKNSKSEYQSTK